MTEFKTQTDFSGLIWAKKPKQPEDKALLVAHISLRDLMTNRRSAFISINLLVPLWYFQLSNNALKNLWYHRPRIALKHPILISQTPCRTQILTIHIDNRDPRPLLSCSLDIPGCGINFSGSADDEHQVDFLRIVDPGFDGVDGVLGERFAEPYDAGAQEGGGAAGAVGKLGARNGFIFDVGVEEIDAPL